MLDERKRHVQEKRFVDSLPVSPTAPYIQRCEVKIQPLAVNGTKRGGHPENEAPSSRDGSAATRIWILNFKCRGLFNRRALNIKKCIRNWVISVCPWPDLPLFFIPSQVISFSYSLHLAGKALNRRKNESGDALASLLTKIASKEHISLVLPSRLRPLIASDWFRLLSGC